MALINRLSRLLRADVHAVLDRMEEPQLLLRQALREMEDAIGEDVGRARQVRKELAAARSREAELERGLAGIAGELDTCFAAHDETLARAVLERRLESERALHALVRRRQALQEDLESMEAAIADHRARLEAMRQRAAVFCEHAAGGFDPDDLAGRAAPVSPEDVEIAYLREKQRRCGS